MYLARTDKTHCICLEKPCQCLGISVNEFFYIGDVFTVKLKFSVGIALFQRLGVVLVCRFYSDCHCICVLGGALQ